MTERLYYHDSFLTSFDAIVTDIRLVSRVGTEALWQVALDRSAFYPTSGGQPHDRGVLSAKSRSGATLEVQIDEVEEDAEGDVWHSTTKPLVAGTEVRAELSWDRRFAHMQQHSGQHLLSALFSRELSAHTVSFHLGDEASTIDLRSASVDPPSIERVERLANEVIAENRPLSIRTVSNEQAVALLAAGELRKLPERQGDIRLIEIEGIDLNACGGTHVRSTGQIGGLMIRSIERMRQGVRVEFVCGLRAIASARRDFSIVSETAAKLSIPVGRLSETVERLLAETKQSAKERQKLRATIAGYEAAELVARAPVRNGVRFVREQFADHDVDYVKLLASKIAAKSGVVALLASTQQEAAFIVFARSAELQVPCGESMKSALADVGLRGGGSPTLAQGQVPRALLDALLDRLESTAEAVPIFRG